MKLMSFKYFKRQRILALVLILVLASTLFSITVSSLLGFYRGFTAYLGEGEDIVLIYNRKSRTPFTGSVPIYLTERIGTMNGVLVSSPEAIAPCVVDDEAIFLRGIIPGDFMKLNQLSVLDGELLELSDADCMIVGRNLAERFELKLGDKFLIHSVLTDQYMELRIKGVYESHSAMDDEALVPLYVGQWLVGVDYSHVTLIRFKIDRGAVSPSTIFEEVAKEASEPSPAHDGGETRPIDQIIPGVRTSFSIEDIGVEEAQVLMKSYMDRYGVTREALLVVSVLIFLLSSASITVALKIVLTQHTGEIGVLRSIGASKRTMKRDILIKLLPWSLVSSAMGILMATATLMITQENSYLLVLSHRVSFNLDLLSMATILILVSLFVSITILRSDLK